MNARLWDSDGGAFRDYDWTLGRRRCEALTAAIFTPLFVGLATPQQAQQTAVAAQARLLAPGGLSTTLVAGGEQWDRPNGWAPLQWMAVSGLVRYGIHDLADTIAHRWLDTVSTHYAREGKLVEKYGLWDAAGGGGGEYPLQDGFGWTNGVVRKLLDLYPRRGGAAAPGG
jgi:alpha,alpha-trehalase